MGRPRLPPPELETLPDRYHWAVSAHGLYRKPGLLRHAADVHGHALCSGAKTADRVALSEVTISGDCRRCLGALRRIYAPPTDAPPPSWAAFAPCPHCFAGRGQPCSDLRQLPVAREPLTPHRGRKQVDHA